MERNVTLNNGVEMPIVGLGTWNLPKENMLSILKTAFDNGYRKIDTAWK